MEMEDRHANASGSGSSIADTGKEHQETSSLQKPEDKATAHDDCHGREDEKNGRSTLQKCARANKKQKVTPATRVD
eukprot:CAMPEP_0194064052 /NCGR_PEP_ID=MMETSP0009_2-20130614/82015_1 /TAXON_ID=210454 /ORGANISM="Grammatophora oceanica, Strain CCMP 410" /LENGTH=75 /DNA_ID=CAMNT_0038716409 /DNA_START=62 /DNA_END=286 /DNA_ORIENTATION=-